VHGTEENLVEEAGQWYHQCNICTAVQSHYQTLAEILFNQ
jgi:hypothetical protein